MAKSIMQRGSDWDFCYICGRNHTADPCGLETHHVFGGANRKFSEKYGLKIHICGERCPVSYTHLTLPTKLEV